MAHQATFEPQFRQLMGNDFCSDTELLTKAAHKINRYGKNRYDGDLPCYILLGELKIQSL